MKQSKIFDNHGVVIFHWERGEGKNLLVFKQMGKGRKRKGRGEGRGEGYKGETETH